MIARFREYLVKHIPAPARLAARAALLAFALAAASLHAVTPAQRAQQAAASGAAGLRAGGFGHTSNKTVVNLRDLAAAEGKAARGRPATAPAAAARPRSAVAPVTTAARFSAAAAAAPALDVNFPGLSKAADAISPPDPSAAASPTQIVEAVNQRLQVYTRGGAAACATIDLNDFFGRFPGETFIDPRVIYDNVNGKFTVMMGVQSTPPTGPHLPLVTILEVAHNTTSDACGNWIKYSVETPSSNIPEGSFLDQPVIGQDRDALLFGGANFTNSESFLSFVAFSYPKSCAYDQYCPNDFPLFHPAHYATPASSGGNPMIATLHSYFVAVVPDTGYELYRMDDSGNSAITSFTLQASIRQSVVTPTRDAGQPGTSHSINLEPGTENSTRMKSTPTYDGIRIWFTHQVTAGSHPSVRYGAINTDSNTVATALAFHSASSDDFNPSIAVGLNGASRTIFLNWAYTDVAGGIPVSDAVAAVTLASTGSPFPVNGKDVRLIAGGITSDDRFGDFSSVSVDPLNPSQVCAVTAQEYFDPATNGKWATRISRFGAPGC
jgi:hypothetical protein